MRWMPWPVRGGRPAPAFATAAWAAAALWALTGCAPTSVPVLIEDGADAEADRKWEKYGAYYVVDEIFVEASFEPAVVKAPLNRCIINKKIKILTHDGARFGTVEAPVISQMPYAFKLEHLDSAGRPVKLDLAAIRREYLESGKIVFPNVSAGSLLSIHIESRYSGPITTMEHWFSGPIPVARGRFTFSNLDIFEYDFKTYGPVRKGSTERKPGAERLRYATWTVDDAHPRSDVDFQDDVDVTEPRVALAIRRFQGRRIFESWEEMGGNYEKYALKTSFFQSTRRLRSLVDSLAQGRQGQLEKAQAVFAWVRKNISYKHASLDAIDPDRVIASGQGNLWEMAVVLREMFHRLDLEADVLITRPRSSGGFDSAFLSPAQLAVPLVSVRIGKRDYLAFPWARGAALGEYPHDYFGLQSLSLADRNTTSLPGFAGDSSYNRTVFRVRPEDDSSAMEMEMELGGYMSFAMRNALMDEGKKEVVEAYQKMLTRLGTSNNLGRCEVSGLSDPGRPVTARITFSNPNQTVRRKGEVQMRLSHIWNAYFSTYDTTRSSGFKVNLDVENSETLRVPKEPGRVLAASIQCRDISNALFRLTCTTRDTPEEFLFQRTVHVVAKRFTAAEMRALAADIQELNRIKESSLVWKAGSESTTARRPAAAGRPTATSGRPAAAKKAGK